MDQWTNGRIKCELFEHGASTDPNVPLAPVDPADPVVSHPNAYFTPHVGGVTDVSYDCMGAIVVGGGCELTHLTHRFDP